MKMHRDASKEEVVMGATDLTTKTTLTDCPGKSGGRYIGKH